MFKRKCEVNVYYDNINKPNMFEKCVKCGSYGNLCSCTRGKCGKELFKIVGKTAMCQECYKEYINYNKSK